MTREMRDQINKVRNLELFLIENKDKLSSIPTITRKEIKMFLGENLDLDEARRNPETNIEQPIYKDILEFVNKHKDSEDLIFVSFRDSIDVTFINKNNEYETPTGLYTYPWKNFYKKKFHEKIEGNLLPNIEETVPYCGDKKYMFFYKLKSNDGILTNETNYDETLSYAKKLLNIFPEEKIINLYINDYKQFVDKIYEGNDFSDDSLPDIHKFWTLLDELAGKKESNKLHFFSTICRSIGINGFMDLGDGYIHPNEKYQTVFFKSRSLFDDIKIIDLERFKQRIPATLNKEYINKLSPDGIDYLLLYSKNPDDIINKLISTEGFVDKLNTTYIRIFFKHSKNHDQVINKLMSTEGYIKKLDSVDINFLFSKSKNKDVIINKLISTEGFINKLNTTDIGQLLKYSKNPDDLINILGEKGKKFISKLNTTDIHNLLINSNNPVDIVNMLGEKGKEYINKLSSDNINYLLINSKNPDAIINKLISTEGFINKMSSIDIRNLLSNSNNPVDIINMLGEKGKEYINNLNSYGISFLLINSKNPDDIINILGEKGKEYINNLNSDDIGYLLKYSKNPDKIKNTLLNKGASKSLFN